MKACQRAHNGTFVKPPPTDELAAAGFLCSLKTRARQSGLPLPVLMVLAGRWTGGKLVSLPITARQLNALRALQRIDPDLGELATTIALAFDPSSIENPQMARLILEKTCRRIVAGQPGSHEAMIQHLERFGDLDCLSPEQVSDFTDRIRKHA